jgi:SulP family sulfate permease
MTGFITGIALLIILGQVDNLTGYSSSLDNSVLQFADLLLNLTKIDPLSTIIGLTTIGLIVGFGFTRLSKYSLVLALAIATGLNMGLTALPGVDQIPLVDDIATIPRSLPFPMLPGLDLIFELLLPAAAIAIIGLVQGAGVGQSYPNPDGTYPDVSRDFTGQGVANIATGLFQGIPCGGSMSGTAVTVNAGARSRWTNISAGLFVAVIVLLFVNIVTLIPMAALAGLLVVVGFQNIRPKDIRLVWSTNRIALCAMVLTLLATLTIPLQFAILVGVAISIMLHVVQSSNRIRVVEFVPVAGGFPVEQPAPKNLSSHQITVLYPYGSLFFATASVFEEGLPKIDEARHAAVILILRGQTELGSTLIGVLRRYSEELRAKSGRLMLAGVSTELRDQLGRTGSISVIGEENLFMSQSELGSAMNEAISTAQSWIEQQSDPGVS